MDQPDDAELLRRYADDRSDAAFTELVRRHLNLVYRSALRQTAGDRHRAQDVAQTVFTELARRAGSLARHPRLAGWLHTATHHVASALLRAERRRLRREKDAHMIEPPAPNHESAEAWERVSPVVDGILRGLGQLDREAILLHFFEGQTYAEVGASLALREDAARMRVTRALEKLRLGLAHRGIQSTAAALGLMLTTEAALGAPSGSVASTAASAMAGATASAPPGGLLFLMSTSKLALGLAVLVAFLAAGSAIRDQHQLQTANAALAAWNQRLAAVEAPRPNGLKNAMGAATTPAMLHPKTNPAGAVNPGSAANPTNDEIAKDLALQRLQDQTNAADFMLTNGPFLRSLGLTPAQMQQLEESLLRELGGLDEIKVVNQLAGTEFKTDPNLPAVGQKLQETMVAEAGAIMGTANLQAFVSYLQNQNAPGNPSGPNSRQMGEAKYVATQVAGLVFASASPLTADQRAQVVQLVANNTPHYQPGENSDMETVNWDGVLAQASGTLPPAQLAAIRSLRALSTQYALEKQVRQAAAAKATP